MNRKLFLRILIVLTLLPTWCMAQQVIVTDDGSYVTAAGGAMLDVNSTSKGFLPPRVALTSSNVTAPVTGAATGLLIYNTATTSLATVYDVTPGYYYYAGDASDPKWVQVVNSTGTGTATMWDDLRVPLSEPSTGTVKPDWAKFPYGASGSVPYLNWFKDSGIDEMYFVVQLPHDWKAGTDLHAHIHWVPSQNGAEGPTVPQWGLQYAFANIGETFPTYITIYASATIPAEVLVKDRQYLTPFPAITATGKTLSSMIICRIFRNGSDGADTFTGLAGALEVDFHYERYSFGSRLEYTK